MVNHFLQGCIRPEGRPLFLPFLAVLHYELAYIERMCAEEMSEMGYEPVKTPISIRGEIFLGAGLKDVSIFFQYLFKWPEYLFITATRTLIFRSCHFFYKIFRR